MKHTYMASCSCITCIISLQVGLTPLHKAAMSGDTEAVQKLIKEDFDVNSSTVVHVCVLVHE